MGSSSGEHLRTAIGFHDLMDWVVAVRLAPGAFDGRDVSRFGYGRAQAVRGPEVLDVSMVVRHGVLPREGEAVWGVTNAKFLEYFP